MQAASAAARRVPVHGVSPEGHGFLPLGRGFQPEAYSVWPISWNHGRGRTFSFVAEL